LEIDRALLPSLRKLSEDNPNPKAIQGQNQPNTNIVAIYRASRMQRYCLAKETDSFKNIIIPTKRPVPKSKAGLLLLRERLLLLPRPLTVFFPTAFSGVPAPSPAFLATSVLSFNSFFCIGVCPTRINLYIPLV